MIKTNLRNSNISTKKLASLKSRTKKIHQKIHSGKVTFTGWVDYPKKLNKKFLEDLKKTAIQIKKQSDVLLVIGIGGSYMGGKAGIDSINSMFTKSNTEVIFIGYSLSEKHIANLKKYLKDKRFSINVISKSGTTLETLATFEEFKKLLVKSQPNNWAKYIFATTDAKNGRLKSESTKNSYKTFNLPDSIGGRYSVLTPVGLLPFAVAGLDIDQIVKGAKAAHQDLSKLNNDAYKYAQARFLLSKKYFLELLVTYSPDLFNLMNWVQQLYGESEGKKGRGAFPSPSLFSRDLHSIGQFIQEGKQNFFISTLNVKEKEKSLKFQNYKTFNEINNIIFKSSIFAHYKEANINNIVFEVDGWDESKLGYFFYFHQKACAMTSYLQGVNPFDQPGVEVYKAHMKKMINIK